MKKILVTFIIILMCFSAVACSSVGIDDDYLRHGTNSNDESVTAVNVNLITSFSEVDENNPYKYGSQFFIEIGARAGALTSSDAHAIISLINARYGLNASYLKYYWVDDRRQVYDYYVYGFSATQNFMQIDSKYGFFFMENIYELKSNRWVDGLRRAVLDKAKTLLESKTTPYYIDENSSRFRFFFVQETQFKAKGAHKVNKTVLDQKNLPSLMWETTDDDYEFSSLELRISAMASGWFVVAIILGVAVVLIILYATRKSINYVELYRQAHNVSVDVASGDKTENAQNSVVGASQMSFEELIGSSGQHFTPQEQTALVQEPDDATETGILDNQISMAEYLGDASEEENG